MRFKLHSPFEPTGDQPQAIKKLSQGILAGFKHQTLLGVTGSGKTFTMAGVIEKVQKPTLVISHNKTLAAQLYQEFKEFFPQNAVHYFVSYYDYYQPEAYIPQTDTYIEKDAKINEEIDRLRHSATQALLTRNDIIIVASVSCIYGIGSPADYEGMSLAVTIGDKITRQDFLKKLVMLQYNRNEIDFTNGAFRIRGDIIEVHSPASQEIIRVEFWNNKITNVQTADLHNFTLNFKNADAVRIFPAKHWVTPSETIETIIPCVQAELKERTKYFRSQGQELEAQRIEQRTNYDLEMLREAGYATGIENYSRYLSNRDPGKPPFTLIDYFLYKSRTFPRDIKPHGKDFEITAVSPRQNQEVLRKVRDKDKDFLIFIDESHMTIPQIQGMYNGDQSRKQVLIEHGFRLPSALDNRPLRLKEFEEKSNQVIYASATPRQYEKENSVKPKTNKKLIVEQIIRPTGLLDPIIEVRSSVNQINDLIDEIQKRVNKHQRVLVTTLTKRMAEELAEYLKDHGIKVTYIHSEIKTLERPEIMRDLRMGKYDALVGINLLREGLDLPEVSLVAILDADKQGFLRNETSLIQTIGRAARHIEGRVIMYADKITASINQAINETERRRAIQKVYNQKHNITPRTIEKAIRESIVTKEEPKKVAYNIPEEEIPHFVKSLENEMELASANLEFERAAVIRDEIKRLKKNNK